MGQFSAEKPVPPGSTLSGNQQSFTTVAGQGWLVGLAEPALDAGTTLAYRRVRRQGEVGSSDRDGLFEQEIGAQKHD